MHPKIFVGDYRTLKVCKTPPDHEDKQQSLDILLKLLGKVDHGVEYFSELAPWIWEVKKVEHTSRDPKRFQDLVSKETIVTDDGSFRYSQAYDNVMMVKTSNIDIINTSSKMNAVKVLKRFKIVAELSKEYACRICCSSVQQ